MTIAAQPAYADSGPADSGDRVWFVQAPEPGEPAVTWSTADGTRHLLRSVTAEEATALKDRRPAALREFAVDAVDVAQVGTLSEPVAPRRQSLQQGDVGAAACWEYQWHRGFDNDALAVYGSESWCGDGSWITSRTGGDCWGASWWPSYHYYDCSKQPAYGVGYNVADLRVDWNTCVAYLGWEGGCMWHVTVWDRMRFGASGGVWWIDGTGFPS
ncbi:hypothetical protein O7623_01940 [Solwaraspora sp. WMMD791]|uniref:hypothetical protein n=1 Tax=Solwaraspora sp. WMMD791 TaxID=3016086 RepID=UPI00249BDE40|nr:hypothetical protein [Solwaraspora sp. WMMD791]WFE27993.1 hypothetical protein O7623_01940 [Solwaraspora sp. WMMD791]